MEANIVISGSYDKVKQVSRELFWIDELANVVSRLGGKPVKQVDEWFLDNNDEIAHWGCAFMVGIMLAPKWRKARPDEINELFLQLKQQVIRPNQGVNAGLPIIGNNANVNNWNALFEAAGASERFNLRQELKHEGRIRLAPMPTAMIIRHRVRVGNGTALGTHFALVGKEIAYDPYEPNERYQITYDHIDRIDYLR